MGKKKTAASEGEVKRAGGLSSTDRSAALAQHSAEWRKVAPKLAARAVLRGLAGKSNQLDGPPARAFETEDIEAPPEKLRGRSGIPRDKEGLPEQEQNPELRPYKARGFGDDPGVYDEMLRTDGTVAGLSGFVKRAVSSAPADIWIPPNPTMEEGRAAELLARFYGLDGRGAWLRGGLPRHVRQALRSMDYGFQPFERIWEPWQWRGQTVLAPSGIYQRASRSVKGWVWDGDRFAGAVQETTEQPSANANYWGLNGAALGFKKKNKVAIPVEQLLLYTFDPSGEVEGNPEGVSIYRPGYIWWKTKRDLVLRYHMAADRLFGGITWLQQKVDDEGVPLGSETDLEAFGEDYQAWVDMVLGWLAAPPGWEAKTDYPGFKIETPESFLAYCDTQMQAVFAAQLLGGQSGAGGEISQQMLHTSIDSIAGWLAEILHGQPRIESTGLSTQLIDYNIPHDESFRYPKLFFKGVEYKNTKAYIDALTKALQYFAMTYTPETEVYIRQVLDMPGLSPEQLEARRAFEALRLTQGAGGEISQGGTQGPVLPPQEEPVSDPDGEDDAP